MRMTVLQLYAVLSCNPCSKHLAISVEWGTQLVNSSSVCLSADLLLLLTAMLAAGVPPVAACMA
jgi:hypothetical protein